MGALGCGDPEAYRLRGGVASGTGGFAPAGVAGASAGAGGTGTVGGAGGEALTGIAGTTGLGGAAGADLTGAAGGSAGAGGSAAGAGGAVTGQGGAGGGVGVAGGMGTGGSAGAGGSAAGAGGAVTGQGGAGGTGGAGGVGGSTGAAGSGGSGAAGIGGGAGGAAGTGAVVNYCDRVHWTAKASVTTGDGAGPPGGIDGDLTTRWGNNHGQNGTDYYSVDFGGIVKLTKITLNNTQAYPDDYPGAYAVYGSIDGTTFDGAPFVTGAGTTGSTVITFTQRTVRAVRVNQTGNSRATNWWQIGEFQVACSL